MSLRLKLIRPIIKLHSDMKDDWSCLYPVHFFFNFPV